MADLARKWQIYDQNPDSAVFVFHEASFVEEGFWTARFPDLKPSSRRRFTTATDAPNLWIGTWVTTISRRFATGIMGCGGGIMGCRGLKVDDLPLVTLCRKTKEFIKAASEHRYALAADHVSYFRSLKNVGDALRKFVDEELVIGIGSPVLTLPSDEGKRKKYKSKSTDGTSNNKSSSCSTSISHSGSALHSPEGKEEVEEGEGSHLHLSSDSDSELDSSSGHLHIHEDIPEPEVPYYPPYTSYTAPWNPPGANPPYTSNTTPSLWIGTWVTTISSSWLVLLFIAIVVGSDK